MCDYVVLPLLNSSFEPGRAREVVEGFVNVDLRNIALVNIFWTQNYKNYSVTA